MELQIPVLALVDSDPYGLKILSVYMKGKYLGFMMVHFCLYLLNQCVGIPRQAP